MKRSEEQSNKYVEDGDNELSQQSRTGTKENKKGKRAIRRGQRKNEIENILHKLRQEEYYPFWYIIGAIMYLCNNLFQSEKMKILFSNILYVERWCTMVRKFCHTCLLWTQEPKFGPSLNDIHSAFDKLTKVPLIELEKAFENIHELPSNPIMKKLFLFNVPKEFPGNPGDLFKGVILSKNAQDKLWIHHEDCSVLQTGLKVYFSEKSDVIPLFHNYEPSITMFKTVHQFWKWWHEPAQVNIFGKFKWNGPEHNILLKLGKTNMKLHSPEKTKHQTNLANFNQQKEDLQNHYLSKLNHKTITNDTSQLIVDLPNAEISTESLKTQSTCLESLEEGDIIKVLFHVSEGVEHVYGKIKIVTNDHYYVDEWSDGDLKFRKISKTKDDWEKGEANEYVPPIIKKNQKRSPSYPTIKQKIKVPFYENSTSDSFKWFQGEIKIECGTFWMIQLTDGEVYKIMKNSKWTLVE